MAFQISYGSLPAPRQDPPNISDLHYALIDRMEEVEVDLQTTKAAQDSWNYLKYDLGKLVIPAEIGRALAAVGLWLNSHAGATVTELHILQEAESDLLF
jgi:hypothetical protein